jgi:hypothetical protein
MLDCEKRLIIKPLNWYYAEYGIKDAATFALFNSKFFACPNDKRKKMLRLRLI